MLMSRLGPSCLPTGNTSMAKNMSLVHMQNEGLCIAHGLPEVDMVALQVQ